MAFKKNSLYHHRKFSFIKVKDIKNEEFYSFLFSDRNWHKIPKKYCRHLKDSPHDPNVWIWRNAIPKCSPRI